MSDVTKGLFHPNGSCRCAECADTHGDQAERHPEPADRVLLDKLIAILAAEAGKTGRNEGAYDVLVRIVTERNSAVCEASDVKWKLDDLRTENSALKSQRDHLNACVLNLQDRLDEYRREVERRDEMLAASSPAAIAEQVRHGIEAERKQLQAENDALKAQRDRAEVARLKDTLVDQDSQATLAAVYLRERDAARDGWNEAGQKLEELAYAHAQCGDSMDEAMVAAEEEEREACCEDVRSALTTGLLTPGQVNLAIAAIRARGGQS